MRPITNDRERTPRDWARIKEHAGRRQRTLAGSYIADLVALGKAVMLCPSCAPKFDADRAGYVTKPNIPLARGTCDGCRAFSPAARLYVKQGTSGL